MSRSNPSEHVANPSTRWFEWNGEKGCVRYYDKDTKKTVDVPNGFTFLLLDQLASVRGWHESSQSGIYSNEVKDTTKDVLVVKSFKGGTLAEGLYKDIKLQVNNDGGAYTANCYIAYKDDDGDLVIGSLRLKGAALGSWMEFTKANRNAIYAGAIKIDGSTEGKKGRVVFFTPNFKAVSTTADTDATAKTLDAELQEFLSAYLKRAKRDQAEQVAAQPHHVSDEDIAAQSGSPAPITDDDIPF